MMEQAIATAAPAGKFASFTVPARLRSISLKTAAAAAVVAVVMAVSYFGFGVNLGTRIATAAEHVSNTAQHSLQANFEAPYINHYGFKTMPVQQQRVYADLYRAAYLMRDSVTVDDMDAAEISALVAAIREDAPEMFYLSPEVSVDTTTVSTAAERSVSTVHLSYALDKQDIPEARDEFKSIVAKAASPAAACQSDANKVNMIQTWMQRNAPEPAKAQKAAAQAAAPATAYDALVNGEGSPAANAQLFNALCAEVGVEAHTVSADTADADATNAVMLGNDWRYVDIAA